MSADRTKGSEIGARVAALRARAGLTQGDVAERLGMSQRLLSYYEREASDIPASMLVPLADVLGYGAHVNGPTCAQIDGPIR